MVVGTSSPNASAATALPNPAPNRVAVAKTREVRGNDAMQAQIDALREEVRQLKEQHHDAILSFDTTLRLWLAPSWEEIAAAESREQHARQP